MPSTAAMLDRPAVLGSAAPRNALPTLLPLTRISVRVWLQPAAEAVPPHALDNLQGTVPLLGVAQGCRSQEEESTRLDKGKSESR